MACQIYPPAAISNIFFTPGQRGLLLLTALHDDAYGLGYLNLERFPPAIIEPVVILGAQHAGAGELSALDHLHDNRYRLTYNIDGVSWLYEGEFDESSRLMRLQHVIAAHLSQQNNTPELARSALATALGCGEDWIGAATQGDGFDWRDIT